MEGNNDCHAVEADELQWSCILDMPWGIVCVLILDLIKQSNQHCNVFFLKLKLKRAWVFTIEFGSRTVAL